MSGETPDPQYHLSIAQRLWFMGKERSDGAPLHGNAEVLLGPHRQRCQPGCWRSRFVIAP